MPDDTPEQALSRLLQILDLRPTPDGGFIAEPDQQEGRLFGGIVLAQSIVAAGRTVAQGDIHSLHAYFLRAGRPATPISYAVERVRDGRNFTTRRVSAYQGGDMIFEATIGFVLTEVGISYQAPMPDAHGPEGQPAWWETFAETQSGPPQEMEMHRRWANPIDVVAAAPTGWRPTDTEFPERKVWVRPSAVLPDDPLIHAAALAYASDSGMVATVAMRYGMWSPGGATASLDHAIWWHHPPKFDDWLLYHSESPAAHAARAVIFSGMYRRDGVRVVSVAQEGLFRQAARAEKVSAPLPATQGSL